MLQLQSLHVYPLKSCRALDVESWSMQPRGLDGDRRWMLVDAEGRFVTGRQRPRLARLRVTPTGAGIELSADGMPALLVAEPAADAPSIEVEIWKDRCTARHADPRADLWLSRFLDLPVRLVHQSVDAIRLVAAAYNAGGDHTSFSDGFPVLLISQASLDGLNARLPVALPMARLRPNLVIAGATPHAEDGWKRIRIGAIEFDVVKPCTRCVFTTVDPVRGEFDPSGEPLNTLKTYRRTPVGITFGQNLIPRGAGRLRVGDALTVLEHLL